MGALQDKNWERIDCPVCGANQFTELFKKAGEPFVKCNDCSLVLINPRPVFSNMIDTYHSDYSVGYQTKQDKKERRIRRWVRRIRRLGIKQGRWLDIGCSVGYVLKIAAQYDFEPYGVDIEPYSIKYARDQLGLKNVFIGTVEDQQFPTAYFDVISAYDVIEHVPDLNDFTAELCRLLSPRGILDLRTPDIGHWRVPRQLDQWEAILPSQHLYYFNSKTIKQLLANHGLYIVKDGFNLKPGLKIYASPV